MLLLLALTTYDAADAVAAEFYGLGLDVRAVGHALPKFPGWLKAKKTLTGEQLELPVPGG